MMTEYCPTNINPDTLDLKARRIGHALDLTTSVAGVTALPYLLNPQMTPEAYALAATATCARMGWEAGKYVYLGYYHKKLRERDDVTDNFPGRAPARQLVYRGTGLTIGEHHYTSGDKFLYINLLKPGDQRTQEAIKQNPQFFTDLTMVSLLLAKNRFDWRDHQFVCIEIPEQHSEVLEGFFPSAITLTRAEVLKGKKVIVKDPDTKVIAIKREDFEHFSTNEFKLILPGLEDLDDPKLNELEALARQTGKKDQLIRVKEMIEKRLIGILGQQFQLNLSNTEVVFDRVGKFLDPTRRRIGVSGAVYPTRSKELFFREINTLGQTQQRPAGRVFEENPHTLQDHPLRVAPLVKAYMAYYLYETIRKTPDDKLIIQETEGEFILRIANSVLASNLEFTPEFTRTDEIVNEPRTLAVQLRNWKRRLSPLLFALLCYSTAQPTVDFIKEQHKNAQEFADEFKSTHLNPLGRNITAAVADFRYSHPNLPGGQMSKQEFEDFYKLEQARKAAQKKAEYSQTVDIKGNPRGPGVIRNRINNHRTDFLSEGNLHSEKVWKIDSFEMDPSGYYTEDTSDAIFKDATWGINSKKAYERSLPTVEENLLSSETGPHLILSRQINLENGQSIKIPIKDHTELSASSITNKKGQPVSFKTFQLDDGTVAVEFADKIGKVYIRALFRPSSTNQIVARSPLYIEGNSLELEKLNNEALGEYMDIGFLLDAARPIRISQATPETPPVIATPISTPTRPVTPISYPDTPIPTGTPNTNIPRPASIPTLEVRVEKTLIPIPVYPYSIKSELIFNYIRSKYLYSLLPDAGTDLTKVLSIEELINQMAGSEVCSCDVCNSHAVIENALFRGSVVNLAFGYLHNLNHLASSQTTSFLKNGPDSSHAYGIDLRGEILDATPSELSPDEIARRAQQLDLESDQLEEPEDEQEDGEKQQNQDETTSYLVLGSALAGIAGILLAKKLLASRKKPTKPDQIDSEIPEPIYQNFLPNVQTHIENNRLLDSFTQEYLHRAYRFLSWVSWGDHTKAWKDTGQLPQEEFFKHKNAESKLAAIKRIINPRGVAAYLKNPSYYYRLAPQLSATDRENFKQLTHYLTV